MKTRLLIFSLAAMLSASSRAELPSLAEALDAKQDLWGRAALRQTNGASYEFFADLLPPLRYVNAQFRHYPIVLSAPGSLPKPRLVSNGGAINAPAALGTWNEIGTPVSFFVGAEPLPFGENLRALDGPRYERGYLPVVQMTYRSSAAAYRQETFASVESPWAEHGVLCSRFDLSNGKSGVITARVAAKSPLRSTGNLLCDEAGRVILAFDRAWQWNAEKQTLTARLAQNVKATLAVATVPLDASAIPAWNTSTYDAQKKKCAARWEAILASAMRVETPEAVVNAAWKATIIGTLMLRRGDDMNYSAGNIYETMYEAESGDAVRALLLWGLSAEGRQMIPPLLHYGVNPGLKFHDAAFKLQLLAHHYWLIRDAQFVREQKAQWSSCLEILTRERDAATGLLPRESYCGDEDDKVFSLNANANAWRGLRDMAVVLEQLGESEEARRAQATAEKLRQATLAAVNQSVRREVQPPFVPIALFGEEKPYDRLTSTRRGSYWNLMIPYVIGAEMLGPDEETWMLRYLEEHGGMCMGMIRFHQHSGLFANEDGLDDLYTLRYVDALLRRDEPDLALVTFYGKLAQGVTRDTFLSAEGTGLKPLDEFGRAMYLPPTCSGSALLLWQLRSLLVQDYDLNRDGEPETLRLLFATPPRWLEDGQEIKVEKAPTAFGEVSINVKSRLRRGEVVAEVTAPARNAPQKTQLRIRLPDGWKIISAKSAARFLPVDEKGTVDVSGLQGKYTVRFKVSSQH